jgi:hypothetical protein
VGSGSGVGEEAKEAREGVRDIDQTFPHKTPKLPINPPIIMVCETAF